MTEGDTNGEFKVFYDGSCPVCSREVGMYRRQRGAERLSWVDVSLAGAGDLPAGLDPETAMSRFHIQTAQGQLQQGARAFAALWLQLPYFRWLGRLASLPLVSRLLEFLYSKFLAVRPTLIKRAARLAARLTRA